MTKPKFHSSAFFSRFSTKTNASFFDAFLDEELRSWTGLPSCILKIIFVRFCGPSSPIPLPYQLMQLFMFLKQYPKYRVFPT